MTIAPATMDELPAADWRTKIARELGEIRGMLGVKEK